MYWLENLIGHVNFAGKRDSYVYGPYGPLAEKRLAGGEVLTYTYTPSGERTAVTGGGGTTRYAYDVRGRLSEVTYPDGRRLTYVYDVGGRLTALTAHLADAALTTTYGYDALNRLVTVTDPDGATYSFTYSVAGDLATLTYPNGVVTTYGYDPLHRLTELETVTSAQEVIQSYAYTLDAAGRRTRIAEAGGKVVEYSYDDLDRLTRESVRQGETQIYENVFAYDPVGNRLSRRRTDADGTVTIPSTYDPRDRLLSAGSTTYAWSANGNLASRVDSDGTTSYGWDDEDRLKTVALPDGTFLTYGYHADGYRERTELKAPDGSTEVTNHLVDPAAGLSRVIAETDGSGGLLAYYVQLPGGTPLAVIRPAGTRYLHGDGLGSIRILTDEAETTTDSYTYTAFGQPLDHNGTDPNPYLFTGQRYDPHSGLYDLRARWMDPRNGRFLSMDPSAGSPADPQSFHPYLYAASDPVNKADPTGLFYISLAIILDLHQPAAEGEPIRFQPLYFPLYVRLRPMYTIKSEFTESQILYLLQLTQAVFSNKAGIELVWHRLEDQTGEIPYWSVKGNMKRHLWTFFSRHLRGDGKSIPVMYIKEFGSIIGEGDVGGTSVGPGGWRGREYRGAAIAHYWIGWDDEALIQKGVFIVTPREPTPTNTTAHELGHALGDLKHAYEDPSRLMSAWGGMRLIPEEIVKLRRGCLRIP